MLFQAAAEALSNHVLNVRMKMHFGDSLPKAFRAQEPQLTGKENSCHGQLEGTPELSKLKVRITHFLSRTPMFALAVTKGYGRRKVLQNICFKICKDHSQNIFAIVAGRGGHIHTPSNSSDSGRKLPNSFCIKFQDSGFIFPLSLSPS